MIKNLIKGTIVGGIILYAWMTISWMVLPWHNMTLEKFENENQVVRVLTRNAKKSGVYVIPYFPEPVKGQNQEKLMEQHVAKMKQGPFVFASVHLPGCDVKDPLLYAKGVAIQFIGAFLMTFILLQSRKTCFGGKLTLVLTTALFASLMCSLPSWNWWKFSTIFTVITIADVMIGWILAGIALALVVKVDPNAKTSC